MLRVLVFILLLFSLVDFGLDLSRFPLLLVGRDQILSLVVQRSL